MRLLHVVHNFVPLHNGGTEVYCYGLCRELTRRHDVSVLCTEMDRGAPQYEVRRSHYRGLRVYAVVHNHRFARFESTYVDPEMDAVFERVLDAETPDVVHIHHLMFHSANYLEIAKRRGIPVVLTLHDYWLSCPNMGQRIRACGTVCVSVDTRQCAGCISRYSGTTQFANRIANALAAHGRQRHQRATLARFVFRQDGIHKDERRPATTTDTDAGRREALVFPGPGRFVLELDGRVFARLRLRVCIDWPADDRGDIVTVMTDGYEVERLDWQTAGARRSTDLALAFPARERKITIEVVLTRAGSNSAPSRVTLSELRLIPRWSAGAALARIKNRCRQTEASLGRLRPALRVAVEQRTAFLRQACRNVDLFIAPSEFMRERMIEFGLAPHTVERSANGVDTPARRRQPGDRPVRFGFVGAISPHKGVHVLIEAYRLLRTKDPAIEVSLYVHGSTTVAPDYFEAIYRRSAGLDVKFAGEFDHCFASAVYENIDVVVIPSIWWENSPMGGLEALASGATIIASDIGGLPEIVRHGVNGLLVPSNDIEALADAMHELASNHARLARLLDGSALVRSSAADAAAMESRYAALLSSHQRGATAPSCQGIVR